MNEILILYDTEIEELTDVSDEGVVLSPGEVVYVEDSLERGCNQDGADMFESFLDSSDAKGVIQNISLSLARNGATVEEIEDVVQMSLLRVWSAADRYQGNWAGLLWRTSENLWIDHVRRQARRGFLSVEQVAESRQCEVDNVLDSAGSIYPNSEPGVEESVVLSERAGALYAAIDELSERHRSMVKLYLAGLTYSEISQVTGVEMGTVKSRMSRARYELSEKLQFLLDS